MKIILAMFVAISLYATQNPAAPVSADEALLNEIEVVLDKLNTNNESMAKNSEEIKRLRRVNRTINRDNEMLLDEVSTKCKALIILNADVAQGVCKKVKKHSTMTQKSKNFFVKIDDSAVLAKYPNIIKQLFSKGLVEFQIRKINGEWVGKRRGYTILFKSINKPRSGTFIMVKAEDNKLYAVSYKTKDMKNYKTLD
jgi:hypothetical protein